MRRMYSVAAAAVLTIAIGMGGAHAQNLYDPSAIDTLEISVFDEPSGVLLATTTVDWGAGIWVLDGISAGENRLIAITTFDAAGKASYWGEWSGLTIESMYTFGTGGTLMFMAVPEGIYVLIPPFTPVGILVLHPFSLEVVIDIKPGSDRNPFNVRSAGVTPVVLLGGPDVDVTALDATTLRLAGVAPLRIRAVDVCTLVQDGDAEGMSAEGPDGYADLLMHFSSKALAAVLGDAANGDTVPLVLSGQTTEGVHVEGVDAVTVIRPPAAKAARQK